jgi:outer membrane protein TolC
MTSQTIKTAPSSLPAHVMRFTVLAAAMVLAGCTVTPTLVTPEEVRSRVASDTEKMYLDQAPISGPISLEEAMARALKYNLDYRLKKMESALALGLTDLTGLDGLPKLIASAGYRTRSNDSGGTSIGIEDRVQSLRPSTSEERNHTLAGAEFSWNVLDFGVSYYRARQQADQFLIAEERRRKVVQNLMQDVRASYWRALGAQRLATQADDILKRANLAMTRSREAEVQKVIAPFQALSYQRALLDATSLLNQRRQDLEFAKRELGALMNVPPGVDFVVSEAVEAKLPAPPTDIRKLEELALLQRPELREEDLKKRISADEARKQLLSVLPGISFDYGVQYDSNNLLYNNRWSQGGIRISWNLMQLVTLPTQERVRESQTKTDEARRMALSMAILTQLRVGAERYRYAVEDFKLADTAAQVDRRLANFARDSVTAKLDSELEAIRTQSRAVLGAYQRATAYASAQIAFGRLYNTLGFDPLPDDFEGNDLPKLTTRIKEHLRATEADNLRMTSNLFGHLPSVAINLAGVEDPVLRVRMKAQITELLSRNEMPVDDAHGMPMTFALTQEPKDGIEKAKWTIALANPDGKVRESAQYATTMPANARNTAQEAALVAAVTSSLPQIRSWLSAVPTVQQ